MAAKGEYRGLIHRSNADLQAWLAKRPPEAALEPGLPIIDPHHHLWDTPVREAIIGWADLMLGAKVRTVLEAEIEAGGGRFRGVRYGTSHDDSVVGKHVSRQIPPHRLLDPTFREGFAELGTLGLSFDSWHFHPQLPDLVDLARAFPDTTIIVDHVGGVLGVGQYEGRTAGILPAWRKSIATLAQC